jgi:hypothetical protein
MLDIFPESTEYLGDSFCFDVDFFNRAQANLTLFQILIFLKLFRLFLFLVFDSEISFEVPNNHNDFFISLINFPARRGF